MSFKGKVVFKKLQLVISRFKVCLWISENKSGNHLDASST